LRRGWAIQKTEVVTWKRKLADVMAKLRETGEGLRGDQLLGGTCPDSEEFYAQGPNSGYGGYMTVVGHPAPQVQGCEVAQLGEVRVQLLVEVAV